MGKRGAVVPGCQISISGQLSVPPLPLSSRRFLEWTVHRFVRHRPFGKFAYPFKTHALIHHPIFKADNTCHLIAAKDKWTIPMAWWNGPVLIALCRVPMLIAARPQFVHRLVHRRFAGMSRALPRLFKHLA